MRAMKKRSPTTLCATARRYSGFMLIVCIAGPAWTCALGTSIPRLVAPEHRHALRRVERPGLHPVQDLRPVVRFGHGAGEAGPVEHFLLAGVLYLRERRIAPRGIVAGAQMPQQQAVGL